MKSLSITAYLALRTLKDKPNIRAKFLADVLWPNSSMHLKSSNQGNGACRGKAAWLCAGSYVGRLKKSGLVTGFLGDERFGIRLTKLGEELMEKYEAAEKIMEKLGREVL